MLFSSKPHGYVYDQGEQNSVLARVSGLEAPLTLEEFKEFPTGDAAAFAQALASLRGAAKRKGYNSSLCSVNPTNRIIRRLPLDPKKALENQYLEELVSSQLRVDTAKFHIAVLNPADGTEYDPSATNAPKEALFCGLAVDTAEKNQAELLSAGLYPESLEISSLASLGAMVDYLRFTNSAKPTLVLELGSDSTQSYIVSAKGVEATRAIGVGLETMVPVVQKELGLKDEESARKLFFSNTFDFSGMGNVLCKRLLKELQSSMGFFEVQTGQSITQMACTVLPDKLTWLEAVIANQLGISVLAPDLAPWLAARKITLAESVRPRVTDFRRLSLLGLMIQFNAQQPSNAVAA
jgi:hypothetical protein